MKRKFILLCLLSIIGLSGCNNSTTSSSSTSNSSINEIIIGVEISGARSCFVGKSIRLVADVLGSENDDVTWESNNPNIATIDENGELKGISEGEVEIKATSVKDPSKFNTWKVSITLPKAEELFIEIETNDNISFDSTSNTYSIPLGQTFYVNSYFLENTKVPDVSYSLEYPDGSSQNTTVKLEMIEDTTRAKVIAYEKIDGLVIKATGKFSDLATKDLIKSVKVNIIDVNNENYSNALATINSFKEKEISSLLSSNITRTKEVISNNESTKLVHEISHSSFTNATYVNKNIKKYTNDSLNNESTINYYQGYNSINMKDYFYTFSYDNDELITKIYESTNDKETISMFFDINDSTTYGYSGLLNNILGNSNTIFDDSIATLGNIYLYSYAEFELTNNKIKITSNCFDEDYSINYSFDFELNYNNDSIISYTLNEEIHNADTLIKYKEEAKDFVYGTKVLDTEFNNDNHLDVTQYYLNEFEIIEFNEKDPNGAYDYSDTTKYGANYKSEENGLIKYSATYDKSIILKVNVLNPTTANVNIDNVTLESSDTSQIPSVVSFKDGIFAINAKKDDNGNSLPGKATFTFKSTLGIEQKVIIEFTKTILKSVNVTFGDEIPQYNAQNETYVYNSIYKNDYSSYFYINTNPDEDIYEYKIDIIEGNENGILLHKFEDSNAFGYPGFSYGIIGVIPGTYKFNIGVKDYFIKDSKTFEITVKEPLPNETIENNIIGKSYEYKGFSSMTSTFTFESNTKINYTEVNIDGEISSTFTYHIEDGAILLDNVQSFTKGSYFNRINEGKIYFSNDFNTLKFHLEIYDENKLENKNFFQYFEYSLVVEPINADEIYVFINNKTFKDDDNLISVTFNNGKGTLNFYDYGGNLQASFTFDYVYDSNLQNIVISNTTSTSNAYSLLNSDYVFDYYNQCLEFKINNNQYSYYNTYRANLR